MLSIGHFHKVSRRHTFLTLMALESRTTTTVVTDSAKTGGFATVSMSDPSATVAMWISKGPTVRKVSVDCYSINVVFVYDAYVLLLFAVANLISGLELA